MSGSGQKVWGCGPDDVFPIYPLEFLLSETITNNKIKERPRLSLPLACRPLFGALYRLTVREAPFAFLCVCAALYLAQFALVTAAAVITQRQRRRAKVDVDPCTE